METLTQTVGGILGALTAIDVDWQDPVAISVVARLKSLPLKEAYSDEDILALFEDCKTLAELTAKDIDEGLLVARLFLGLSKDQFSAAFADALGSPPAGQPGGAGLKRYKADRAGFLAALKKLGLDTAMTTEVTKPLHWSDTLVERLRSGRGSAIAGQQRGRGVEDFAEAIVKEVFGEGGYQARVTFSGKPGRSAKCDFAIPTRVAPRIIIEAKGYGATGSKMTDVIGDIEKIIDAKRGDTFFLFLTDGLTWKQRQSDLRKIVTYQNNGDITRIYTYTMAEQMKADLRQLKAECGL